MFLSRTFALLFCLLPLTVRSYQWPSPQYDALEELLYQGQNKLQPISLLASGCISRVFTNPTTNGPPIGAEWLRLAYHDMATHNITDGTGGLDASLYYEYNRAENVGAGIINSLNDFGGSANKYVSRADVIAMGAIWGVTACGGPPIAFRGGRIDALAAGRLGVPQPQEDLKTHTESFRLQGFNATEMISLVACGHTIGGVRNLDFPNIVTSPNPAGNETLVASFDTTIEAYDSTVVSQYLNGTTQNPLVVVSNTTLQSDLRIFSSDRNATMKSMNSPAAFNQTCATLLGRMLHTVPSQVQLTDEITFLPFKIGNAQITIVDSQLVFHVEARVQLPAGATLNATLLWCDRRGPAADCADGQANFAIQSTNASAFSNSSPLAQALGISTMPFVFNAPLGNGSLHKFWFEIGNTNDGTIVVEDNGGAGYIIEQDMLISLPIALGPQAVASGLSQSFLFSITAGVLGDSIPTLPQVQVYDNSVLARANTQQAPSVPPILNTMLTLNRNTSMPAVAGYNFYSVQFTSAATATLDFTIELNGTRYDVDFMAIASNFFQLLDVSPVGKRKLVAPTSSAGAPQSTTTGMKASSAVIDNMPPSIIAIGLIGICQWFTFD